MSHQPGHGGNIWKASLESAFNPSEIIDFSASIVPIGMSERAVERVRNSIQLAVSYPDPDSSELRGAISAYHGLPVGNILVGNGSIDIIYLMARVLAPRSALIVDPAFSEYRRALKLVGSKAVSLEAREEDGFAFDLKKLTRRAGEGFDVVYLANPSSPIGALARKEAILELADECSAPGVTVVVDEAFCDFTESESVKEEACERDNLVVLRSMTKFFGLAGLRVGYAVSSAGMIKRLAEASVPWSINTLASIAAIETLADVPYINRVLMWFDAEHSFLFRGLEAIDGVKVFPSSANFFTFKVLAGAQKATEMAKALYRDGVLIRQLGDFKGLDNSFVRVALRTRKENEMILERMAKLAQ